MGGKTRTFWWALASCALMIVGALGPWVTVLGLTVGGTEGDGWIVIGAALVAGGLVIWHDRGPRLWKLAMAGLAGLVALGTGAYDWSEIDSIATDAEEELEGLFDLSVSVGWGLILCTIAAASLVAAVIAHYLVYRGASFTPAAEPAPDDAIVVEEPPARLDA
jgi:hypothetical protein